MNMQSEVDELREKVELAPENLKPEERGFVQLMIKDHVVAKIVLILFDGDKPKMHFNELFEHVGGSKSAFSNSLHAIENVALQSQWETIMVEMPGQKIRPQYAKTFRLREARTVS